MTASNGKLRMAWITFENIMGVRKARLEIGDGIEVHGDNESGKSTTHAALKALGSTIDASILRIGEEQGKVYAKIVEVGGPDEYDVQVQIGKGQGKKVKKTSNGVTVEVKRPDSFTRRLFGDLAFDPLAFAQAKPLDQKEMFCRAFPCSLKGLDCEDDADTYDVDLDQNGFVALRQMEEAIEFDRREIGRTVKQKAGAAAEAKPAGGRQEYDEEAHEKGRRSLAQAEHDLATVDQQNADIARHNAAFVRTSHDIEELERRLAEAGRELEVLGGRREEVDAASRRAAVDACGAAVNAYEQDAESAEAVTAWKSLQQDADAAQSLYDERDKKLLRLRGYVAQQLTKQIDCPIEGLEVTNTGLQVGGVPLSKCNTEKRIRFGVQVAGALQADKEIKFVAIDNAESITPKNRLKLRDIAIELGLQWVWLVANDPDAVPKGAAVIDAGEIRQAEEA